MFIYDTLQIPVNNFMNTCNYCELDFRTDVQIKLNPSDRHFKCHNCGKIWKEFPSKNLIKVYREAEYAQDN